MILKGVEQNRDWPFFRRNEAPGLYEVWIEAGGLFMLYKVPAKSNQQNLGTIKPSNLWRRLIAHTNRHLQYHHPVALLAFICGKYDFQDPDNQTPNNLRGKFRADENGKYWFYCYYPTAYSLPTDGPSYQLLTMMDRHPMRPAHIHIMVSSYARV